MVFSFSHREGGAQRRMKVRIRDSHDDSHPNRSRAPEILACRAPSPEGRRVSKQGIVLTKRAEGPS
jgi:hypothetical protein